MENINFDDNRSMMDLLVKHDKIHQFIYKYIDLLTLKRILKSGKIKFSKPSSFNDSFDCNLTIDTNNTDLEITDYVNKIAIKKGLSDSGKQMYHTKLLDPVERFELTNKSIKQAKESFGVSCFSKKFDNLLMWAHYANKHNGVVVKFDVLQDADFFMTPFLIDYKSEYPIFNYFRNIDSIGKFLLETKSLDWQYEDEMRVMKEGSGLYQINKAAIVEIIFGCRVLDRDKEKIVKIANRRKWKIADFTSATMNLNDFKLDFNKYAKFIISKKEKTKL